MLNKYQGFHFYHFFSKFTKESMWLPDEKSGDNMANYINSDQTLHR